MNMRTAILVLAVISVLVISGCVSQTPSGQAPGPTGAESALVTDVGSDLSGVNELGTDLDSSDLEGAGSGLDDLTW